MSDPLRLYGLWPTRLLRPWDFPGKSTGVGCHFLLQGIFPPQGLNPALQLKENSLVTGHCLVTKSCLTLASPCTVAHQAPLSMGFPRQEYWNGLPFPPSGDLPDPGIKPMPPSLAGGFFTTEPPEKPLVTITHLLQRIL